MSEIKGPIFPRIRNKRFLEAAKALPGMDADNLPWCEELAGDLRFTLAADVGSGFVMVTPALLRERGIDHVEAKVEAFRNLADAMQRIKGNALGPVFQVDLENDLSACSIVWADLWRDFARQLGCAPVAVFAHRNLVLFTGETNAEGVRFLEEAVAKVDFTDTHALSRYLYVFRNGWDTYPTPGMDEREEPMVAGELSVSAQFGGLDGAGRLTFPSRFKCSVCSNFVDLDERAVAAAMQAHMIQARVSILNGHEAPVFKAVADAFAAMSPECFVFDFRCPSCDSPFVVGCEGSRLASGGFRYQPLKLWAIE